MKENPTGNMDRLSSSVYSQQDCDPSSTHPAGRATDTEAVEPTNGRFLSAYIYFLFSYYLFEK